MSVANECIPKYEPGDRITAKATAGVTGKRLVAISGPLTTEGNIAAAHATANLLTDDAGRAVGAASHDAANGELFTVIGPGAVVPIDPEVDITAGQKLAQTAAGKVKPAGDTETVIGVAFSSADESNGEDVLVKLL